MSQEPKGADGAPGNSSDAQNLDNKNNTEPTNTDGVNGGSVAYSTYDKVMKRLKKMEAEHSSLVDFKAQKEQEVLEAKGNFEELVKNQRAEIDRLKKQNTDIYGSFARKSVSQQIALEAAALGCVDSTALEKLVDLSSLEVDGDTFQADNNTVKSMVEDAKVKMPWLFSKKAPNINTSDAKSTFMQTKKTVFDMTPEEQAELARKIDEKEGRGPGWSLK